MANPIEILLCWQAVVITVAVAGTTQFLKVGMDIAVGRLAPDETPTVKDMAKLGKNMRRDIKILDTWVMPTIPLLIGFVAACVLPVHPEVLQNYVEVMVSKNLMTVDQTWLVMGPWGAACGQFADYIVSKIKRTFGGDQ